jgi:hypothetical protein
MIFKNILYYGFFYSMIMNLKEIGKLLFKNRDVKQLISFFKKDPLN